MCVCEWRVNHILLTANEGSIQCFLLIASHFFLVLADVVVVVTLVSALRPVKPSQQFNLILKSEYFSSSLRLIGIAMVFVVVLCVSVVFMDAGRTRARVRVLEQAEE